MYNARLLLYFVLCCIELQLVLTETTERIFRPAATPVCIMFLILTASTGFDLQPFVFTSKFPFVYLFSNSLAKIPGKANLSV